MRISRQLSLKLVRTGLCLLLLGAAFLLGRVLPFRGPTIVLQDDWASSMRPNTSYGLIPLKPPSNSAVYDHMAIQSGRYIIANPAFFEHCDWFNEIVDMSGHRLGTNGPYFYFIGSEPFGIQIWSEQHTNTAGSQLDANNDPSMPSLVTFGIHRTTQQ